VSVQRLGLVVTDCYHWLAGEKTVSQQIKSASFWKQEDRQMARKKTGYEKCSICRDIPDRSEGYWKGGDLIGSDLPKAESKLEIVGAPFYNDSTSHSHSCLKKCPKCGTYYDWSFSYEFLVNGSEDEIILTRIAKMEGLNREERIFESIKKDEEEFQSESNARIQTLLNSPNGKGVYGAAYFLHGGQLRGHDIAFAVSALVKALIRISNIDRVDEYLDSCSSMLYLVLWDAIQGSQEVAREVVDTLHTHNMTSKDIDRIDLLISACRKVLQSKS